MKTTTKKDSAPETLDILEVTKGRVELTVLGTSPLLCNSMSSKAQRDLLLPPRKKNSAERMTTLKHNPLEEFRNSIYRITDGRTLLGMPAAAFKRAMMTAALDLPGTNKSQIGRLTFVEGDYVEIFGVPKVRMAGVRSADMNRTPDIRTIAIVPEWCAKIRIAFARPLMQVQTIGRLLTAAGLIVGVGDGRNEKGKLSFGAFELVEDDNETVARIVEAGGREAQIAAMEAAEPYDDMSQELLSWFNAEVARREMKGVA